ncbi:hypothetical protein BH11MYX3_BH11MYX3_16940 [soil metagenome]
MSSRTVIVCSLLFALVRSAHADFAPGEVPEATNAYTLKRRDVHLSMLGTSSIGLTDNTELASYLIADVMLFPNLRLEHRFVRGKSLSMSWQIGAAAGAYPIAVASALPFPGGVIGGAGVGFAWGAIQSATLLASVHLDDATSLSVNGGGFLLEGGLAGLIGGGGVGGSGGAVTAMPASASGHRVGGMAGFELARTFGRRDAVIVACDAWVIRGAGMDEDTGVLYPRATWTHVFSHHFHLTTGAYALLDPPSWKAAKESKMPVGPYVNVSWTWD